MSDSENQIREQVRIHVLNSDIKILSKLGCADNIMEIMIAEHGSRCETLAKALVDPGMGKAMLLCLCQKLIDVADQINERTVVI